MRESQGYVMRTGPDGKAQVNITMDSGKGCSAQTEHCHCAEASPKLNVKVLNKAGAAVGDYVSIIFKSGAILKSVLILVGLPALGILMGAVTGTELNERSLVSLNQAIFAGAAFFAVAVLVAVLIYRSVAQELQPFVDRIITTGLGAGAFSAVDPVCGMAVNPLGSAAKIDYEGRTYYFCHTGCLQAFVKEPQQYLQAPRCARLNSSSAS
jgi:YHS domain-containing protein/positive regulator of sigma E activity